MSYTRANMITEVERQKIRELAKKGVKQNEIAKQLKRSTWLVDTVVNQEAIGSKFFDVDSYGKNVVTI